MYKVMLVVSTVVLLLVLGLSVSNAKEIAGSAEIEDILQRLMDQYPPTGVLPNSFSQNQDVGKLIRLVNDDLESYLAAVRLIPTAATRALELSEEELEIETVAMSSTELPERAARAKRTEEEFKQFLVKVNTYHADCRKRARRHEILTRSLELWGSGHKVSLLKQVDHPNWHVRAVVIPLLFQFVPGEKGVVDALIERLPKEYPWHKGDMSGEKGFLVESPVAVVERLSQWRIPEVLPYVRKLGTHPFYHYRRYSMAYIRRYGVQEAIPHMIKLLDDEAGLVRAEAFGHLALLAGIELGQNWDLWYDDKLGAVQKGKGIEAWTAWWTEHGKGKPEVDFHSAVIERAFALMEKQGPWNFGNKSSVQPIRILEEHLITGISTRQNDETMVSEFKAFWKQNKRSLYFDDVQQRLVLLPNETDKLQQNVPTNSFMRR